jgi:hypothetical protein
MLKVKNWRRVTNLNLICIKINQNSYFMITRFGNGDAHVIDLLQSSLEKTLHI